MELVKQAYLKGERALFKSHDLKVEDSIFADGESPLKESDHIDISGSIFKWKYPLWYCNHKTPPVYGYLKYSYHPIPSICIFFLAKTISVCLCKYFSIILAFRYLSNIFFNSLINVFTSLNSRYTEANLTYATASRSFSLSITSSPIRLLGISFSSRLNISVSTSSTN